LWNEQKMSTARERRLYYSGWNKTQSTGVMRWPVGHLKNDKGQEHPHITVTDDGQVMLDTNKTYPDDSIAFARDWIMSLDPNLNDAHNKSAVNFLNQAIAVMDQRAVKRHGYSYNQEERDLKVPYE